jgi:cytochrome b-561
MEPIIVQNQVNKTLTFLKGMLAYRFFRRMPKFKSKLIHAVTNMLAMGFAITGLVTIVLKADATDYNTSHAWLGIAIITFYVSQWLLGFVSFLFPKFGEGTRRAYLAYHRFWGVCIFVMSCANVLLMIGDHEASSVSKSQQPKIYSKLMTINGFMASVVMFCVLIVSLVTPGEFARPAE